MRNYIVYQRHCRGNRSVAIGQFQSDRTDRLDLREELYCWLHNQGIRPAGYGRYTFKPETSPATEHTHNDHR